MQSSHALQAVDSHTAGEPTRIVTGGLPRIDGATMAHKRAELQRSHDHLRRALVLEPRGHDAIVVAFLLPPCAPGAHLGVVFGNDAGYLGMCGHGAIGVATVAVATGLVPAVEPVTEVVLDTPAGVVTCRVAVANGRPQAVTITNVPSFLFRQRVVVPVHGFGKVAADIAWGGNWFAFVEADQLGLAVEKSHLPVLLQAATSIREAMVREGVRGVHPDHGEAIVDHVKLFVPFDGDAPGARAMTLCPGTAYDRSPCGTGTSAKLAVLHAKGELEPGRWFVSESVLGTRFRARIAAETRVGALPAIVAEVEGSAWITALTTFVIDPDDPLRFGLGP
ncbi:MAG: proline racemase family protein [Planctomycetes bacterium]|nr:proline racemase family protein [Planctomycetota bacterium]